MAEHFTREYFASRLEANGDSKLNAAADFAAYLLKGPYGNQVARILLFGSVARNQARPDSDVDIMVFIAADPEVRSIVAADAAWEATVQWGELVSQISYSLSDLIQPRSYLIYNTLRRGREIYSMEESEIRRLEIEGLVRKAHRTLQQAQREAEQGGFELSMVGAYNVVELLAKAFILLKPNLEIPSSHGGMIQTFGREYVKTGEVPNEWGRLLHSDLELRSRALYDTHSVLDIGDVQPMLTLAQEMLGFLEKRLSSRE